MKRALLCQRILSSIRLRIEELKGDGSILQGVYSVSMPSNLMPTMQFGEASVEVNILKLEVNPISQDWIEHMISLQKEPYQPNSKDPYEFFRVAAVAKYTEEYVATENVLHSLLLNYRHHFDGFASIRLCRLFERHSLDEKLDVSYRQYRPDFVNDLTLESKQVVNLF